MFQGNQRTRRGRCGRGGVYGRYGLNSRELVQPSFISLDGFKQSNHFDILGDSVVESDGDDEYSMGYCG